MKMITERANIEKNESEPSFSDVLMGALIQKAPQARNITSAVGRARKPIYGPNPPQRSVNVESMIKVVAITFLWYLSRVTSTAKARITPTTKTPKDGKKSPIATSANDAAKKQRV
jgi:hypothetical protein